MEDVNDLISRQDAVDALDKLDYTPGEWAVKGLTMCKDAIKAVPSAEPDVPDENVGDLIRRQDAIDAVCMDGCGLCREAIEQIGGGND